MSRAFLKVFKKLFRSHCCGTLFGPLWRGLPA